MNGIRRNVCGYTIEDGMDKMDRIPGRRRQNEPDLQDSKLEVLSSRDFLGVFCSLHPANPVHPV